MCSTLALRRALAIGWLAVSTAQNYYAIARIRGAKATYSGVSGYVKFEQDEDLGDLTVTYNIEGLTEGLHGFHVHQYGDTRVTDALDTMSAHFVPYCMPPEADEDCTIEDCKITGGCADDQVHGLPPSLQRQPGDMGNIVVEADGTVTGALPNCCGQQKMSLTDPLRSIVGRVVVIHMSEDRPCSEEPAAQQAACNAEPGGPYGRAGGPIAYGVIGIAAKAGNGAAAPNTPKVDKIICTFEKPTPIPTESEKNIACTMCQCSQRT